MQPSSYTVSGLGGLVPWRPGPLTQECLQDPRLDAEARHVLEAMVYARVPPELPELYEVWRELWPPGSNGPTVAEYVDDVVSHAVGSLVDDAAAGNQGRITSEQIQTLTAGSGGEPWRQFLKFE